MPFATAATTLAAVLLGAGAAPLHAFDGSAEAAFFESLPVVLTVSRLPQPMQDTPGAVTVIDERLIAATGYRDLGRLFRLVPGMQVGQERGNDQWITYHGLGSDYPNQMQVLVDGRSVYSPYYFGGADWGALPLAIDDIERIEVVRGSDSAAYGSNAFLGVVNIITRHTSAERGSSVAVSAGSNGIADASARVVTQHGALGLRITARHLRDDGMPAINDGRESTLLNLRGDLRVDPYNELTVHAGINQGRRGMGYRGTLFDGSAERTAHHVDRSIHLRWRHAPSADEEWSLSYYHNRERTRDEWFVDSSINPPSGFVLPAMRIPVNNNRDSRRDNVELQHRHRLGEHLHLLWGAEWRRDWLDAPDLFYADPRARSQNEWRLFGNAEWRLATQWLLNAGLMVERIDADRTRMAPRLFLNWQPEPAHTVRLGWSRAWRQPSIFERSGDVRVAFNGNILQYRHLSNPHIQPSRIDGFEIGYLGLVPAHSGVFDLRLFHERIDDMIIREPATVDPALVMFPAIQAAMGATRWSNSPDRIRLNGFEYQLRLSPWTDGELILNHSMVRASARDRAIRDSVAPYTASLSWLQSWQGWQTTLTVLRMGPLNAGTGYVPNYRYRVPAYTTLDFSIARSVSSGGQVFDVRLSGINLLGRHQELAHRPLQASLGNDRPATRVGRQIFLSVRTEF